MSLSGPQFFAFLGNPGKEYERTRHNLGWLVADSVSRAIGLSWVSKLDAHIAQVGTGSSKFLFCKPQTFMNMSGVAVKKVIDFYKVDPSSVVLVYDEIDLPFGIIAVRIGGGANGHNGVRSVDTHLGTLQYMRIKNGVGRPQHRDISSFVLSRFNPDEESVLPLMIETSTLLIQKMISGERVPEQKLQTPAFRE